ncbi:ABC transporter permease [candidate division KSB1 bacterium]|nr:ABC transporter permease [candidate division KSB1 bacterium]
MRTYILKRILSGILLVIGLLLFTFFLVRLSPGNPASIGYDPLKSSQSMSRLEKVWGLDQPVHTQFYAWVTGILHGDFGRSYSNHKPVTELLKQTIPNTLLLTVPALVIQVVVGILLGLIQIIRHNTWLDRFISSFTLFIYAIPAFWLALILIMLFSQKFGWLPSSQMISFSYDSLSLWQKFLDRCVHLLLPVLTMSLTSIGITSRYIRNGLVDIMDKTYITAARARGLSEKRIIFKHALRNTLVPVITVTGQYFPVLISSSVVIELIFSWPGMGRLVVLSSYARDYPVIIACTFLMAVFVVLGTLLADILNAIVDPRIRLQEKV